MTEGRSGAIPLTTHAAIAIAGLVAIIVASWTFADHLIDLGGPRWDAWYYTGVARTFPDLPPGFMNPYQLQRIVPSMLVNAGMRLTGQPRDDGSITVAFLVFDILALVASALLWLRVARREVLGAGGFWLGFGGLFLTFASLRFVAFNPAMTDTAVLLLGMLLVTAFLERRPLLLAAVALVGGFTWPIVAITAAPLLLFPRGAAGGDRAPADRRIHWIPVGIAAGVALLYLVRVVRLYLGGVRRVHSHAFTAINEELVWLSIPIVVIYLYVVTRTLLADVTIRSAWRAVRDIRLRDVALVAIVFVVPMILTRVLATPGTPPPITGLGFLSFLTILPVVHPGRALVAHVLYFSPVLLLTVAFWPRVAQEIRRAGLGMVGAVLFSCYIALSSESRQSTLVLPMLVTFTALAVRSLPVPRAVIAYLCIASVLTARPWSRLGMPDAPHRTWTEPEMLVYLRAYFDHTGPWMSELGYFQRLLAVAVLSAGLWLVWRFTGSSRAAAARAASRPA